MLNDSRKTGLLRLKHLREMNEATAETMDALRPRFERLADPANAPRVVSSFNLFQTPEPLAARLAEMFPTFGRTLEPSAGLGRLYRAVRDLDNACEMVLVEQAADCCRELYTATEHDNRTQLIQADFLTCDASRLGRFDSIIMNPPFKMGTDIKHITHALTLLAPGGQLVSLCYNGTKQRAKLKPLAATWIDLPAGSFRSEGTNADAAIVVFTR